ncbi:MAG: LLM class flavin-dependent oxidoreductase [Nonomuraea sp.]|nr:LLM class flavin-dependent oxidoreductase [Nonomuraea sp.]
MFDSRFGLLIPQRGVSFGLGALDELLGLAVLAEESGVLSSVWVGDSLTAQPRPDALALLGSLTATTSRVRLGTACMASFPLRDPAQLAGQWATLDHLSGGRMVLGACTGLVPGGQSAAEGAHWGVADGERAARLEEGVEICRALWRGGPVDFTGRFRSYRGLAMEPVPAQEPCPVLIAANPWDPAYVERALRRVARLGDGWMTASSWPGLFEGLWERLRPMLPDPGAFPVVAVHNINIGADREECLAETGRFIAAHEGEGEVPREMVTAWTAAGPPERCARDLRALLAKGVTHVVIRLTSWHQRDQLDRLLSEVLPLV